MEWSALATVLVATIGGTGLVGLLSGGLQLSRRTRLRKSVEDSEKLLAILPKNSPEAQAIQLANRHNAIRWASMSFVRISPAWWAFAGLILVTLVALLVLFVITGFLTNQAWVALPIVISWTGALAAVLAFRLEYSRVRILRRALNGHTVDDDLLASIRSKGVEVGGG